MKRSLLDVGTCLVVVVASIGSVRAEMDRWESPGPYGLSNGSFAVSAVNPGLLVVTDTYDLYCNASGNDCWIKSSTLPTTSILQCDRAPWETDELYVSGYKGLWRSRDAGLTWVQLTPSVSSGATVHVAIDSFLHGHIVCEVNGLVMESFDGGSSWMPRNPLPLNTDCDEIQVFPQHPDSFLVDAEDLLVTTDHGSTWQLVPETDTYLWDVTAGYDRTIWAFDRDYRMYRYSMDSQSWYAIATPDEKIQCLSVDRCVNRIWLATDVALYNSTDQGVTWRSVATFPNIRAISAAGNGILVHSNYDLFLSTDDGATFSLRTCDLTGVWIRSADVSAASGTYVAYSDSFYFQKCSVFVRNAQSFEWDTYEAFSGAEEIRFDQSSADRLITRGDFYIPYGPSDLNLMVSEDLGQSFHPFEENLNAMDNIQYLNRSGPVGNPMILSSVYNFYCGCSNVGYGCATVAVRVPGSTCWEIVANTRDLLFGDIIQDASDPSRWYAQGKIHRGCDPCEATDIPTGLMYRSEDSGRTWTGITPGGDDELDSVETMIQCLGGSPFFLLQDHRRIYVYDTFNNQVLPREELHSNDPWLFPLDTTGQDYVYSQNSCLHRAGRYANFGTIVAFGELTAEEYHQDLSDPFHIVAAWASHRSVQEIRLSECADLPVPLGVSIGQDTGVIDIAWTALPDLGVKLYRGNEPGTYISCDFFGPDQSSAEIENVSPGIPVYIRLTHYNRAGCESVYSDEYTIVPGEEYGIVKAGGGAVESGQEPPVMTIRIYARPRYDEGEVRSVILKVGGVAFGNYYFRDDGWFEDEVAGDSIFTESINLPESPPPGMYFYQIRAYDNQGFYTDSWPLLRVRERK